MASYHFKKRSSGKELETGEIAGKISLNGGNVGEKAKMRTEESWHLSVSVVK
jgi:hypothetical protein